MSEEVIENVTKHRKKRETPQKAEDFIGWISPDGKLKVADIAGYRGTAALFKVTCTECSKDPELFPDGYFISTKGNLVRGIKPCGCSNSSNWFAWQYLLLAHRAAKGRFIVHGFAGEFKNQKTKLNLECLKDGHKWTASISNIINGGTGCPKCKGVTLTEQQKTPEHIALQKCSDICKEMDYDVVGFPSGYKNCYSCFEYSCKIHGKQRVSYNNFVYSRSSCKGCYKDRQKELGNGNGYYPERKDEVDYLYILDFNSKFIKIGRSFDVERRIPELQRDSGIQDILKLRIFTATHKEIYDYEQELHTELRERNFQHYVDWSNECFQNDCQFILNRLLNSCNIEEVKSG